MDGLTQWLSFQTDPIDSQDSVPYMDGPSPRFNRAEETEIPEYTRQYRQAGQESCQAASVPTELETKRLLVREKTTEPLFTVLFILHKKFPKGALQP